ncbi:hypothetical protein [Sinorhizobium meliloti]|nr:hypothetical protein [Sinorhizobium meliloti]
MKPGYRPPLTPWEDYQYRSGIWHTAAYAVVLGLTIISMIKLV